MRLPAEHIKHIKAVVYQCDPKAIIYLFGSRVDDQKRGGDIDLLVFSQTLTRREAAKIRLDLYDHLGEQKIDLVLARDLSDPFVRMAKNEGVLL